RDLARQLCHARGSGRDRDRDRVHRYHAQPVHRVGELVFGDCAESKCGETRALAPPTWKLSARDSFVPPGASSSSLLRTHGSRHGSHSSDALPAPHRLAATLSERTILLHLPLNHRAGTPDPNENKDK